MESFVSSGVVIHSNAGIVDVLQESCVNADLRSCFADWAIFGGTILQYTWSEGSETFLICLRFVGVDHGRAVIAHLKPWNSEALGRYGFKIALSPLEVSLRE